jgi:hypothetical protein
MYTKIFLFVLIFNLIPQKVSNEIHSQKQNMNVGNSQNISNGFSTYHQISKKKSNSNPLEIDWSDIGQHFGGHQNSDDDGKANYIHFERYLNRRNRNIYCLIAKLVLLISYLSSLFCNYIHLCH